MATVSADDFKTLINDADIVPETVEIILDTAIDNINLWAGDDVLSNMGGTAGTKTLSVTSRQRGAIYHVARAIYQSFYKGVESTNAPPFGFTNPDVLSNPVVQNAIKEAARQLTEIDVSVG